MAYSKNGYFRRAEEIQRITNEHYEPGRQDRCLKWVWKRHIYPTFGVCYSSYLGYLKALRRRDGLDPCLRPRQDVN